jgi:DNA polymerase V
MSDTAKARSIEVQITQDKPASGMCADLEPFALQVADTSMEPEFAADCVVIVDPSAKANVGAFILAELEAGWSLGQLRKTNAGALEFAVLNPGPAPVNIKRDQIRGVVTQRAGRRRSYFKRYA